MTPETVEIRVLSVGEIDVLTYSLRRTDRRRTVGIFVEPYGQVVVLAPPAASVERIEQIVRRRLKWIRGKQRLAESYPSPPQPREWVAGETHRYLGRQYRLKLAAGCSTSVKLVGGYFLVVTPDPQDRDQIRKAMEDWYKRHAFTLLSDRVRRAISLSSWLRMEIPPIRVRLLTRRWGSTAVSGRITFNIDLVKLPLSCIDYVVAHELVHLKIPNHSPAFWGMLGRVMPNWRKCRSRLASAETS
ncbi:M48 family metallopeptidase [Lysobacter xanthus]